MAAAPPVAFNPVGAQCTLTASDPCLYQVAGYFDNNPAAQLSGCQSLFGFPTVPTVTLSADRVFSTDIATSIYTDIITSTNTLRITTTETMTYTITISETDTEYTTTVVNTALATEVATITTRVAAAAITTTPPAKRLRRRACGGKHFSSSATTSSQSSVASPSSVSSQVSFSSPSASISEPVSASASSTTASVFPQASACPNEAAYSSACSCLEPPAATESSDPITSIIRQTDIITVTETSYTTTVQTITQTLWADDYVTTTATATFSTNTQTTTSVTTTTTTTVNLPIPTLLNMRTNETPERYITVYTPGTVLYAKMTIFSSAAKPMKIPTPNSQPYNPSDPDWKMYMKLLNPTDKYGLVALVASSVAASQSDKYLPVHCSVDGTLAITCTTTSNYYTFPRLMVCSSTFGMIIDDLEVPNSGCSIIELTASE